MAPQLSAATMNRPVGFRSQPREETSWQSFSKALSRHLRATDPAFRLSSDRMVERGARKAK